MKFYLFLCISLTLANSGLARSIELLNTESTSNSSEKKVTSNTENTLCYTEKIVTPNTESSSDSSAKTASTTRTDRKCPENMLPSSWRPMATTLECYCDYPFLPLPVNNTCFELFKQGPCEPGHFLVQPLWTIEGDLPLPQCAPNPCLEDGLVPYHGMCHNIIKHPLCEHGRLYFKKTTSELICQSLIRYQSAISAPSRSKCPVGSREDRNGICRKKL